MNKHVTDRICSMQCIFMQNWSCKSSAKFLYQRFCWGVFLQNLITCSLSVDLDFLPPLSFSHNLVRTLAELHVLIGVFYLSSPQIQKGLSTFAYLVIQQFIFKKISGENSCTSKNPDHYPDLLCDVIQRGRKHKIRSRKTTNVYPCAIKLVQNQLIQ